MKLGILVYIMAPAPISTGYFKNVTAATNTYAIEELLDASYKWRACGSVVHPPSLLGNGSVNMFPRQQGITGGVIFYAVRVVSKESRRLVLPRTSCKPIFLILKK
jgi:hypothetical protein